MRPRHLVAAALLAVVTLGPLAPASAQDPTTTTAVEVPSQDIVPQPDSGSAPSEAGDRGGALQLALLAVVVVVIGGAVYGLVRQSRRARGLP